MKGKVKLGVLGALLCALLCVQNVKAETLDSPYVTFSPDGNAFTVNADETDTQWYEHGTIVQTGESASLPDPKPWEHIYPVINRGQVRVEKWVVHHSPAECIHKRIAGAAYFHGVEFREQVCHKRYYSGWKGYCADCGQLVTDFLCYMSREAAASIHELDMSMGYYHRCPWCHNLEQGLELKQHICQAVSVNQYSVRYHANFGSGYMPKSIHMYNNAVMYEGKSVTPQSHLTLNSYTRQGYEFNGWNTEQDGSGQRFADGAEIYNLCAEEQGCVILYAQWRPSQSVLRIDPGEGAYHGRSGVTEIKQTYGSEYMLNQNELALPSGAKVSFDTQGGMEIAPVEGRMIFADWSFLQPMKGSMEGNTYIFTGTDGSVDEVCAVYQRLPIVLPDARKEGYSFGGWFYDKAGTIIAGGVGDELIPADDITLYAYWVDLQLTSEENCTANSGKGAVNLQWTQADGRSKTYMLYQRKEDSEWKKIYAADEVIQEKNVKKSFGYTGKTGSYTIPYTGYYRLTAQGAQGENYGTYTGGKGGQVTAEVYLKKGEKLEYAIGGQNGYNGGGRGSVYGGGGGRTSLSTARTGMLLIAGGGGGASELGNGGSGGSAAENVQGNIGEAGMAGGGGGYRGGTAGAVERHSHTTACRHVHIGSSNIYGGCYTVRQVCGGKTFTQEAYKETFYYGNLDWDGNIIFCVRCGSYQCPGHRDTFYHYICNTCGKTYENQAKVCTALSGYGLGCGRGERYICGYSQGQILRASAGRGGSNYVNQNACRNYQKKQGIGEGNGNFILESIHVGLTEKNELKGVTATDCQPPDRIDRDSVKIRAVAENKVNVYFEPPADQGTVYYHMAESYDMVSGQKMNTSNQTVDTLISGIRGYRYVLNESSGTAVTGAHTGYIYAGDTPCIGVSLTEGQQYLHIAAEDKAGNLSETLHVPLSRAEVILWPIATEPIEIQRSENVYKSGEYYYVKADGTTGIRLSFDSRLGGSARADYQINRLLFQSQDLTSGESQGALKLTVPMDSSISAVSHRYTGEQIRKQYQGKVCITDAMFTESVRSGYSKEIGIAQDFVVSESLDGHRIRVTPGAGIVTDKVTVTSDHEVDLDNGILLIADGKGPVITGMELPEHMQEEISSEGVVDWEYVLEVNAVDQGSGLREFELEIRNLDNGGYEVLEDADGDGRISVTLSAENTLFLGEFVMTATAVDMVGNISSDVHGMDAVALDGVIEKLYPTGESGFQRGESGKLSTWAYGYMDKVEVVFPTVWTEIDSGLNHTYIYEPSNYLKTEGQEFMVPMKVPDGQYTVVIKGYKEGQELKKVLEITVSGSVLDELRTRLR